MSLSSLKNTAWLINAEPTITVDATEEYDVVFKVTSKISGNIVTGLNIVKNVTEVEDDDDIVTYQLCYGGDVVYEADEVEFDFANRRILFIDGDDLDDSDLISWLESNAVRVDITDNFRVQRKTLAGSSTAFTFDSPGLKFLVKNLSDENAMLVNFEDVTDDNAAASVKIPPMTAQVILTNEGAPEIRYDTIYVKGTGDVEVQEILW